MNQHDTGHGNKLEGVGKRHRFDPRRWRKSRVWMVMAGMPVAIQTVAALVQLWNGR